MRIHKEGRFFLGILFISLIVINLFIHYFFLSIFFISSLLSFSVFLFFLQFFRNPKIDKRERENSIISPANGKVVFIGESYEGEYFKEKKLQISIFMSPFDVHVNRYQPQEKLSITSTIRENILLLGTLNQVLRMKGPQQLLRIKKLLF